MNENEIRDDILAKMDTAFSMPQLKEYMKEPFLARRFAFKISWPKFLSLTNGEDVFKDTESLNADEYLEKMTAYATQFIPKRAKGDIELEIEECWKSDEFFEDESFVCFVATGWSNYFHESREWDNSANYSNDSAKDDLRDHILRFYEDSDDINGVDFYRLLQVNATFEEIDPDCISFSDEHDDYDNDFKYYYMSLLEDE